MSHYLFSSHDGFGLGHVRRNSLIAKALLDTDPGARVTIVTGLPFAPRWLRSARVEVVQVPPLLKRGDGTYRAETTSFETAVERRASTFLATVERALPDVIVVDRHPYGTAGELRPGIEWARARGIATVLGLRDILDEPEVVREELAGAGWADVSELFDHVLVYGARHLCDHEAEYGLELTPEYCGWVCERLEKPASPDPRLVVVAAGGGGDGDDVFALGLAFAVQRPDWTVALVAGPFADHGALRACAAEAAPPTRLKVHIEADGCAGLFAAAASTIQMAGYNSTFEALAAGRRPILVPRHQPRREQAIRAQRLAALDLADVVDEHITPCELGWLLDRAQPLSPERLARAGIVLHGAEVAASILSRLAVRTSR